MRRFTHTFPQRISAFLLCLALCLGLLPVTALAAAEGAPSQLYVGNRQVSSGNDITYWTTDTSGGLVSALESDSWNVKYDPTSATLTLSGATIKGDSDVVSIPYGSGIYAQGSSNQPVTLTIELIGENTITGTFGIYVNATPPTTPGTDASLVIKKSGDNGSLTVTGTGNSGLHIISGTGDASLTIKNASVDAKTTQTYSSYAGVCVQSGASATGSPQLSLAVNGGSLTASGTGSRDGILFYVGSSQASNATTSLTVSENAIVDARNGGISASRISVTLPTPTPTGDNRSGIVFDGTEGTVYGSVTLQEDLTIGEGESLTIPDGSSLNCNGKLTNNGTINVEDGGSVSGNLRGDSTEITTPTITTPPTGQTVTAGNPATFAVTASDVQSYQWQQRTNSGSDWTNISENATSSTYTISNTTTDMSSYQYRCVVTSASGVSVTSSAATLTVNAAATTITTQPGNVTVTEGETATFTVDAMGSGTLTYQWQQSTDGGQNWADISGANSATYTIENTTTAMSGYQYHCVVTGDGGTATSNAATLTVTALPEPEPEPEPTPPPYIPPSKPNWTSVARKLANAKPGDTVTVKMNGETEVPGDVWETIAGRDVTVVLDMGGNASWTVDGNDVPTATHFADMDFGVDRNTTGIDVDVINAITGQVSSVQITLAHDGEFGFTLTLTAPLGRENAGRWANLYHYDENAKTLNYETSAQVASDGTASLRMTHASQYAIIIDDQTHQLPFEDVPAGAWYEGAVRYAYLHDIMEGMSATTFQPNGTLSRAMAVQIFYNLEGQPDISDENLGYPYEDVNAQAWYGNAVYWARLTGVATGYGDGTFQPGDSITRQEFAQMLYNYAKYKGYDLSAEGDLSQFPDAGSIAGWAETAMSWANGNQLINGHDDGTLEPGGTTTRAQAASILMRFDQNLVEN